MRFFLDCVENVSEDRHDVRGEGKGWKRLMFLGT